jgi:hypothetical protein
VVEVLPVSPTIVSPTRPPQPTPRHGAPTLEPQTNDVLVLADPELAASATVLEDIYSSPPGRSMKLLVTEDHANGEIQRLFASADPALLSTVKSLRLDLTPAGVWVDAGLILQGLEVQVRVLLLPQVQNCAVELEVAEVRLGVFKAPSLVRQQVTDMVAQSLDPWLDAVPVCVEEIQLDELSVLVTAHR